MTCDRAVPPHVRSGITGADVGTDGPHEGRQLLMRRPALNDLPPLPLLPTGHTLRPAVAADAAGIADVLASAFGPEWTVDRVRGALLDAPDVETTFVVAVDGRPVATASARLLSARYPGSGYLHWVGAHPSHRGRGLGASVTLAVLRRFRAIGCRDAVLETDPPRLPAIRLYLGLGFRPEPLDPAQKRVWQVVLDGIAAVRPAGGDAVL